MEGDDEEEEEGSLTEKSHDEAPESPSPVTTGVYEEDEEEEETETAPLAMSYEHTRRYLFCQLYKKTESILNNHSKQQQKPPIIPSYIITNVKTKQLSTLEKTDKIKTWIKRKDLNSKVSVSVTVQLLLLLFSPFSSPCYSLYLSFY